MGKNWWAKWPYTVQVRSEMKPVPFKSKDEVRWVIEHPLPLFVCFVDKSKVQISIYHTFGRFHAWSIGQ